MSSMIVLLFACLCLIPVARATSNSVVTVANPLDNQLPTIARVNKYWTWAPSPNTFRSADGDLRYATSTLPHWMAFDALDFTFTGTPSEEDEGYSEVTVTAYGPSSSAASRVTFCVSRDSPPVARLSIAAQFHANNPSLSSVFLLSPGSSLDTGNPILRIPSKWSFSIGFGYSTYKSTTTDVYYGIRQADGSDLPGWMVFNRREITLNGVVPSEEELPTPATFHLRLHASGQEGYSAASMPFDIVVASHELSATNSMPTINVTITSPFNISLNSPADFSGIFVDSEAIHAQNISDLMIDVSGDEDWLRYDPVDRSLAGNPRPELAGQRLMLPVKIRTTFNQSIDTNVSVALVPSYFTEENLPTIYAAPGNKVSFSLAQYLSNSSFETSGDVDLSMVCEPMDTKLWLRLSDGLHLEGTIPEDCPTTHTLITFIAYSHVTHSTSHASLSLYVISPEGKGNAHRGHWDGHANAQHAKLVLALAITLGIIGILCLICGALAIVRKMVEVQSTIFDEGKNTCDEGVGKSHELDGDRPANRAGRAKRSSPKKHGTKTSTLEIGQPGEMLDLELRRVPGRNGGYTDHTGPLGERGSGVANKRGFLARLRQTLRYVSNKCSPEWRRMAGSSRRRSVTIGRPVLAQTKAVPSEADALQTVDMYHASLSRGPSDSGSMILLHSPSTSTAGHSIPQRRRDFGVPKPKIQGQSVEEQRNRRFVSRASTRSNKSLTVFSQDSASVDVIADGSPILSTPAIARQGAVTLTASTQRQASPQSPPAAPKATGLPVMGSSFSDEKSNTSEKVKTATTPGSRKDADMKKSNSGDELRMGLRYVQAFGADNQPEAFISTGASSHMRSSFSSLASSSAGCKKTSGTPVEKRVIVIPGQRFRFLVRIPSASIGVRAQGTTTSTKPAMMPREYNVKIISGQPLSQLHVDLNEIETRGTAEVTGESTREDIGVIMFGIYTGRNDEICLAMVIIEVAETR